MGYADVYGLEQQRANYEEKRKKYNEDNGIIDAEFEDITDIKRIDNNDQ